MRRAGALLFAVVLLAGCGGHKQSKAERAAMNAEFAQLDFKIAQWTMGPGPADQQSLEKLTQQYVEATRKYADDLGDDEVKRRLSAEAEQLQPWCLTCVDMLNGEAESR